MDPVAETKARIDLAEHVGRHVQLSRAGRNLKGLCPFHAEKTPSFYVFPDRQSWRCFGQCAEGGDLFSFEQKRTGQDFRIVLESLAAQAGVVLRREDPQKRERRDHLASVLSAAVEYYQRQLKSDDGAPARKYLFERRGLNADSVETFHLGWAPDEWTGLRDYLQNRGYSDADGIAAGVLIESETRSAPYDRFRGRVIFPIADTRGVFVGLAGRGLHGEEPKYMNSPQTELFDKGRTLYGMNLARTAAQESRVVVVVEGYMDVIGPWQAGFRNVVATMGTALTPDHVEALRRLAPRIVLALDPDNAGQAAAERAGVVALGLPGADPESARRAIRDADEVTRERGIDLRVATLPGGRDPDEIAMDEPTTWESAIADAMPYAEFAISRVFEPETPASPLEARRMVERVLPLLLAVRDPIERGLYVQRVARRLGVPERSILDRMPRRAAPGRFGARPELKRRPGMGTEPEDVLLALFLRHPSLRTHVRSIPADLFTDVRNREVFKAWAALDAGEGELELPGELETHLERLRHMRLPVLSEMEARRAAGQKLAAILRERLSQRQQAISAELGETERSLGANALAEIAERAWRGEFEDGSPEAIAQSIIEGLELGLSLHRKEPHSLV